MLPTHPGKGTWFLGAYPVADPIFGESPQIERPSPHPCSVRQIVASQQSCSRQLGHGLTVRVAPYNAPPLQTPPLASRRGILKRCSDATVNH